MSKKDLIEHLRQRLASNDRWALRALVRIYQNQTADERCREATIERNGIGFTGPDAEILTSFASQYQRRGRLTEKQMMILRRRIPAYAKQIVSQSDTARLEAAFCGAFHTQSADIAGRARRRECRCQHRHRLQLNLHPTDSHDDH